MGTYVIIGAGGGMGSACCRRLAASGATLVLCGRSEERLISLSKELGAPTETYPLDATRSTEVNQLFEHTLSKYPRIDGVVNLVGSILLKPAHLLSDEEFEQTLSLNLRSAFYVLRAAAKAMSSQGSSVVLMSTVATRIGLVNHEAIAAAKAGVNGLVISAAATYAARGIRVNAVAPGLVRTPLSARITSNELALKASTSMHPLGRIGEPDDIASAICWLLDPANSWVTGQILSVDGGLSTVRAK